jgi:hypothetical protein
LPTKGEDAYSAAEVLQSYKDQHGIERTTASSKTMPSSMPSS